jgi:ribonuclease HI
MARRVKDKSHDFIAYSDGSCDNLNPQRPGGAAYIILDKRGKEVKRMSKGFKNTTNNRMELLAIISIVNSLPERASVLIHTDSQYCILAIRSRHPACNLDQLTLYHNLVNSKKLKVDFNWVKGHDGNTYNELCDQMARSEYNKMLNKAEESSYYSITTKRKRKVKPKKYRV